MNNKALTTTPLISVIVPIYNAEQYLERSLDCLGKQTYSNLEFVLVNDGSSDDSGCICDKYASHDCRFKVFHIPNGGASLARKFGLTKSAGEYISFIDSDDYISHNYIEHLYSLISTFQVNISACRVQRVVVGQHIGQAQLCEPILLQFDELMPRFFKYEFWGLYGKLYHKNIWNNIDFSVATLSEDYYIMAQLFLQERHMVYADTPLYFYEYHEDSLSHTKLSNRAFEEFENVHSVYQLTKKGAPQYASMALSNVVETCVKLLSMVHKSSSTSYKAQTSPLLQFIRQHFREIMLSHNVYWKLKVLIVILSMTNI